jgi:hypothetical protein
MDEVLLTSDVALNMTVDTKGAKLIIIKTYGHSEFLCIFIVKDRQTDRNGMYLLLEEEWTKHPCGLLKQPAF